MPSLINLERLYLLLLLMGLCLKSVGQAGEYGYEFGTASSFKPNLVIGNGDTLNRSSKDGFYEGLHIYTDNESDLFNFNDTTAYTMGRFLHGL